MRMRAALLVCVVCAAATSTGGAAERKEKQLREAIVRAEHARQLLATSKMWPDASDFLRARRSLDALKEPVALTPFRGAVGDMRRTLRAGAKDSGGQVPPDVAKVLVEDLEALIADLRELLILQLRYPPDEVDGTQIHAWNQRLATILEEESLLPEQEEKDSVIERWGRKAWHWFHETFGWMLELSPGASSANTALQIILGFGLFLLALFLGQVLIRMVRERRARETEQEPIPVIGIDPPADEWALALKAAQSRRWEEAFRHGYFHLVHVLERRGITRLGRNRTNREILDDVSARSGSSQAAEEVRRANRIFDEIRYGGAPGDEQEWTGFRASVERAGRLIQDVPEEGAS